MDPSFGGRLRLQRERHQIALTDVAERTKIKLALLEGLERDDITHWPVGIFRRSYVRAYAQAIGLEPDTVVREFLDLYPEPVDEIPAALAAARMSGGESTRRRPPTRLRFLIGSALDALPALRAHAGYGREPVVEPSVASAADTAVERLPRLDEAPSARATPKLAAGSRSPLAGDEPLGRRRGLSAGALENAPAADRDTSRRRQPLDAELSDLAHLCSRLACAAGPDDVVPVLEDAARLVGAIGLIVWIWDIRRGALRHVLGLGYSNEVLAQLTDVKRDADNAIAAAFRSGEARVVNGKGSETGAVVVPLPTPTGCAGVLALELQDGGERREYVRAFAGILAAQLSTLIGYPALVEELTPDEGTAPGMENAALARES